MLFALYRFLHLLLSFGYGVSDIFMSVFHMELNDYPLPEVLESAV
jgi:hypothetical protein